MAVVSSAATSEIGMQPEEGNQQVIEQGHAGAGAADLLFRAEGPPVV